MHPVHTRFVYFGQAHDEQQCLASLFKLFSLFDITYPDAGGTGYPHFQIEQLHLIVHLGAPRLMALLALREHTPLAKAVISSRCTLLPVRLLLPGDLRA